MPSLSPYQLMVAPSMPAVPKTLPLLLQPSLGTEASITARPVLQVLKHDPLNLPPPPPPPPLLLKPDGQRAARPKSPPASEEPPLVVRRAQAFTPVTPRGSARPPPRPPPKLPALALRPTPPKQPPPPHAIILARKGLGDRVDLEAVRKSIKPPTSIPRPPPPSDLPPFVRTTLIQGIDELAQKRKAGALVPFGPPPPPPTFGRKAPKAPAGRPLALPQGEALLSQAACLHLARRNELEKMPTPVPDFIRDMGHLIVRAFMGLAILNSSFFIICYGLYLPASALWATHAATFVGCLVNLGFFESVKCIVMACVALVKDETVKRQAAEDARKARMLLKAQAIDRRRRRLPFQVRSPTHVELQAAVFRGAPPPLMG